MTEDFQTRCSGKDQRSKDLRVGRSNVGKGVFSRRWFHPEQIVGEIRGQVIYDEHHSSDYCMYIGDGRCLEPDVPFRYLNHSCEPNCEFDWYDLATEGKPSTKRRAFLFALRVIRPGDELTIDYNWPATAAIRCRCKAPSCRGWIVAERELAKVSAKAGST